MYEAELLQSGLSWSIWQRNNILYAGLETVWLEACTPDHVINDFIAYRQAERTEGYHQR